MLTTKWLHSTYDWRVTQAHFFAIVPAGGTSAANY
jgi:hypothetical protein